MNEKLSILVPSITARAESFQRIMRKLGDQAGNLPVEIYSIVTDGSIPTGEVRQSLVDMAQGDYIAFVDDDDDVSDDYVSRLLDATDSGADVLTFDVDVFNDGVLKRKWSYGLKENPLPSRFSNIRQIQASHICAWRSDLAKLIPWCPIWFADDVAWFKTLHATGLVTNEHHIDAPLYRYHYSPTQTANQTIDRRDHTKQWCGHGVECYFFNGTVAIACENIDENLNKSFIGVRTAQHERIPVNYSSLKLFHTIRVG